jgi:hypothetical protein
MARADQCISPRYIFSPHVSSLCLTVRNGGGDKRALLSSMFSIFLGASEERRTLPPRTVALIFSLSRRAPMSLFLPLSIFLQEHQMVIED